AQFPDIAPPTVQVTASFPGANSQTVAETVATVIEQEVNGVENMLYMSSSSTNAGQYTLTVTFNTGTDLDQAQVLVQNRVAIAEPRLPSEVQRLGVTTKKSAPDILLGVNLVSPNGQYDQLYMSNYATRFVRDRLARLDGVGDIATLGARDFSMRVWLDVDQLAARGIAVDDVLAAISEQNVQVAAGRVGQPPDVTGVAFDYALNTKGRLLNAAEFEQIVVRTGEDGALTRLVDVARIELGAENYDVSSTLDGEPTVLMAVFQRPGSNALSTADGVYDELDAIAAGAPEFAGDDPGLAFEVVYDTTRFVKQSINDVVVSLLQAVGLVFLVTLIFLQSWRTTVIPMVAVPVSLVGTFGVMQLFGFSLNNLSLFGLVLAIGVVTDDAVVITEAVVTKIKDGLAPKQAAREAMSELFAAVIATSLVLLAVFVPTAFVPGISGQFYQQFALTIAAATVISLVNALTLTPAYCGVLLKPADAKPDPIERVMNVTLGWFFNIFNAGFAAASRTFGVVIAGVIRLSFVVMCVYGGLLYLAYLGFSVVPAGFIPQQDNGYLIYNAALPDGASIERTEAVAEKIDAIIGSTDGVANVLQIPGYSLFESSNVSNFTSGFIVLDPFEDRVGDPTLSADAIMNRLSQRMRAEVRDAGVAVFGAPPVSGIGTGSGFKLQIQDREGKGSL
ncbi:MAG: efflux RND transporter permease subunit, partial [Planctomycetota bacterium]